MCKRTALKCLCGTVCAVLVAIIAVIANFLSTYTWVGNQIWLLLTTHGEQRGVRYIDVEGVARAAARRRDHFSPSGRGPGRGSGFTPEHVVPLPRPGNLSWSWRHPKGRLHTMTYGTAIDDERCIYLSAADAIRKFSPDGDIIWEYETLPADMSNVAFLSDGALYGCTTHGHAFALDVTSGALLWDTKVCPIIAQDNGFVTAHDGLVVIPTDATNLLERNGNVTALNASDGTVLWSFVTDAPVWNFMASYPGDGTLVFQDLEGKGYRLRLRNGELLWKAGGVPGSWSDATATLGPNNVLYTCSNYNPMGVEGPGKLSAMRLSDGKVLWTRDTSRPANNAVAVGPLRKDGRLSVVIPICQQCKQGTGSDVLAFDADTGDLQWTFVGPVMLGRWQAGDSVEVEGWERMKAGIRPVCLPNGWGAPTIDAAGWVFVGNQEGPFFALKDVDGDGKVEGPEEVIQHHTDVCFAGTAGPSTAPGLLVVANCDTMYVFKTPVPPQD